MAGSCIGSITFVQTNEARADGPPCRFPAQSRGGDKAETGFGGGAVPHTPAPHTKILAAWILPQGDPPQLSTRIGPPSGYAKEVPVHMAPRRLPHGVRHSIAPCLVAESNPTLNRVPGNAEVTVARGQAQKPTNSLPRCQMIAVSTRACTDSADTARSVILLSKPGQQAVVYMSRASPALHLHPDLVPQALESKTQSIHLQPLDIVPQAGLLFSVINNGALQQPQRHLAAHMHHRGQCR